MWVHVWSGFFQILIEIADGYHAAHNVKYIHIHAEKLTVEYLNNCQPTKICMLSSLQHFSVENLEDLIRTVGTLTGGNAPLFFSDIPDVNHLYDFYNTRERRLDYERRRASGTEAIGTWWSRRHLIDLFASHSYAAEMRDQHSGRANAHYRFDLLARPV